MNFLISKNNENDIIKLKPINPKLQSILRYLTDFAYNFMQIKLDHQLI